VIRIRVTRWLDDEPQELGVHQFAMLPEIGHHIRFKGSFAMIMLVTNVIHYPSEDAPETQIYVR
jgi:hypothetical protein